METDILLEGFIQAERIHGVRYTKFIGDGDSSVHPTLIQSVPGWGHMIQRLECANHMCKCYGGALEQLVKDNPSYKGSGGLTLKMRKRLVSSARCAIKMRSRENDKVKGLALLKNDFINGPRHCFGIHAHCSPNFCQSVRSMQLVQQQQFSTEQNPASRDFSIDTSQEIIDTHDGLLSTSDSEVCQLSVASESCTNRPSSHSSFKEPQLESVSLSTMESDSLNVNEDLEGKYYVHVMHVCALFYNKDN